MTTKRPDVVIRNKSLKQRLAVGKAHLGMKHTEEAKRKIAKANIGNKKHLGHKHSLEAIAKIKEARKKQVGENHPNWKGGLPKCIDCKKQLKNRYAKRCRSCFMKDQWKRRKKNGWKLSDSSKQNIRKNVIRHLKDNGLKQDTSIELKIKEILDKNDIQYEHPFKFNNKFLCDFAIINKKIIIECDGDYWHNREDIKKRDKAKNAYIRKCGWRILRFWEKDINNNIGMCENKILKKFKLP